jgi:hypothetical protein
MNSQKIPTWRWIVHGLMTSLVIWGGGLALSVVHNNDETEADNYIAFRGLAIALIGLNPLYPCVPAATELFFGRKVHLVVGFLLHPCCWSG